MEKSDYLVQKVWSVEFDESKPVLSLGIPKELLLHTMYEETELLSIMGFGHMEIRKDCENNKEYILFKMNADCFLDEDDDQKYFMNVHKFIKRALQVLEDAVDPDIIFKFDSTRSADRFWRVLVYIESSLKEAIKDSEVNAFMEKNRKGAHIALQWNKDKGVLRVKSRSLNQLRSLLNMAINDLLDQV